MKIGISVVSHDHDWLIEQNEALLKIAKKPNVTVIIKDNIGSDALKSYCVLNGLTYIANRKKIGFGENNNEVFEFLKLQDGDWFLVMNPDVVLEPESFDRVREFIAKNENTVDAFGINLFRDAELTESDESVRRFPKLVDFAKSVVTGKNDTKINKEEIGGPVCVDWISGSFLCFRSEVYRELGGFDTRYFMYCEDLDIGLRLRRQLGSTVVFVPDIKAVHFAKHQNRRVLSKHFYWHIISAVRYLFKYYKG